MDTNDATPHFDGTGTLVLISYLQYLLS